MPAYGPRTAASHSTVLPDDTAFCGPPHGRAVHFHFFSGIAGTVRPQLFSGIAGTVRPQLFFGIAGAIHLRSFSGIAGTVRFRPFSGTVGAARPQPFAGAACSAVIGFYPSEPVHRSFHKSVYPAVAEPHILHKI